MYLDYTKLWKLLLEKNMTKTDLLSLTGISSRVIAKLTKNQTVTTETLAKICEALSCELADIAEIASEEDLSLYQRFLQLGSLLEENDGYKVTAFSDGAKQYHIYTFRMKATKHTNVYLRANKTILWEHYIPLALKSHLPTHYIFPCPKRKGNEIIILLIKGAPAGIAGQDENGFVSYRQPLKEDSDVYLMTEAEFKLFDPTQIN